MRLGDVISLLSTSVITIEILRFRVVSQTARFVVTVIIMISFNSQDKLVSGKPLLYIYPLYIISLRCTV